jgi:hypothetical protein
MFRQRPGAVGENFLHVMADKQSVDQRAAGHGIFQLVAAERAAILIGERVSVPPEPIRPTPLFVAKIAGWIPAVILVCQRTGKPWMRNRSR